MKGSVVYWHRSHKSQIRTPIFPAIIRISLYFCILVYLKEYESFATYRFVNSDFDLDPHKKYPTYLTAMVPIK